MRIAKLIQRRLRESSGGVQVSSDVNAAVAANVGERGQTTTVSSTQQATTSSEQRTEPR